jgi:hypothetical protein
MCGWCNVYGRLKDEKLAEAFGISTRDIISPGSFQSAVCSDKALFDRARPFLSTKMTADETERYCEAVRKEHPRVLEAYGTGLLFLKNCDFLKVERFVEESWTRCSDQELLDAGVCTESSTTDAVVMDGRKSVRFGDGGEYFPAKSEV